MNVHSLSTKDTTMNRSQTILITGATSGIGRAAALHLARKGHRVFAAGRRATSLASLQKEVGTLANGGKVEALVLDVTSAASIAAARDQVLALTGGRGIDALVNNAGYGLMGPLEEIPVEALRAQYETNVFGLMAVTHAFLPAMRARGSGRIVNISSIGGKVTAPMMGAYSSTKYAVESLSDALRIELRPFGVQVVLIEPGSIATGFSDVAVSMLPAATGSPYAAALARTEEIFALFAKAAVGPAHVVRAIETAIESRRPSARYIRPWRTYAMLWFARLLPTALTDAVLAHLGGLTRRALKSHASPQPSLNSPRAVGT
jgi:short-subunit dehydrogenase